MDLNVNNPSTLGLEIPKNSVCGFYHPLESIIQSTKTEASRKHLRTTPKAKRNHNNTTVNQHLAGYKEVRRFFWGQLKYTKPKKTQKPNLAPTKIFPKTLPTYQHPIPSLTATPTDHHLLHVRHGELGAAAAAGAEPSAESVHKGNRGGLKENTQKQRGKLRQVRKKSSSLTYLW